MLSGVWGAGGGGNPNFLKENQLRDASLAYGQGDDSKAKAKDHAGPDMYLGSHNNLLVKRQICYQ